MVYACVHIISFTIILYVGHAKIFEGKAFQNLTTFNFNKYPLTCNKEHPETILDPCANSDESFTMTLINTNINIDERYGLLLQKTGSVYENYCIEVFDDLSYGARICRLASPPKSKKEMYG